MLNLRMLNLAAQSHPGVFNIWHSRTTVSASSISNVRPVPSFGVRHIVMLKFVLCALYFGSITILAVAYMPMHTAQSNTFLGSCVKQEQARSSIHLRKDVDARPSSQHLSGNFSMAYCHHSWALTLSTCVGKFANTCRCHINPPSIVWHMCLLC